MSSILLLVAIGCLTAARSPGRSSSHSAFDSGAPAEARRPKAFHVRHYSLSVSFDESAGEVFGDESVEFEPLDRSLRFLVLDAEGLRVESVEDESGESLRFEVFPKTLSIDLGGDREPGRARRVRIRYLAFPKRGLRFVRPDPADPGKSAQIWSQGEQNDNHFWFACQDRPDDLASTEVTGTVRTAETLVSNGRLVGVEEHRDSGTRTFHWRIEEPHAVYLTSIVVGTFTEISERRGNVDLSFFVPPSVDRETAMRSFGRTGEMLERFSRRFGVAFPFSSYTQTAAEEFFDGMENVTAATVGDRLFHPKEAEPEENSEGLVAHELAHQWFGDSLTCAAWSEVWLNESFADFAAGLWTEESLGEEEYRLQMLEAERAFFEEDRSRYRRPLLQKSYFDSNELFDRVAYDKGNWVLAMLRSVVGDRDFFRGVEIYLRENAAKNVDTAVFQSAMERAAGRGLGWFFDEWVRSAGYPEYRVASVYDPKRSRLQLTIDQVQDVSGSTPLFSMPVGVDFETTSGFESHRLELRDRHGEFSFPVARAPRLVRFDPGNRVLKLVRFEKTREELRRQAVEDPDVTGRIWAAEELARRFADAATAADLAAIVSRDPSRGARGAAAAVLEDFPSSSAAFEALRRALGDGDSRVRAAAAASLSSFKADAETFAVLSRVLEGDPSGAAAGAAAQAIGELRTAESFPTLLRGLAFRKERAAQRGIFLGLAALETRQGREEITRACSSGRPEAVRLAALAAFARVKASDPATDRVLEGLLADSDLLVQTAAVRAIGELKLVQAVPALRLAAEKSPLLREEVDSAIRRIDEGKKEGIS